MGVVYLAKDPVIGRLVAIKTIKTSQSGEDDSESREFRERFVREAQTAGILSHPNIVTIHDIGEDTESRASFIAMEYIEGKNLKSFLNEKNKFTWDEIADLIAQIGEALDYAHRKGIIHRDVKPANIILTTDGKVKITDFGIAKVASSNLTTTGQFLGTPNYMSPEQVSGAPVDGRSDIFSLGVVLYELLTNRKPFQGDNLTAISYKIVHEDFTPPAELSTEVPPEFNPIVARAMAKDPWNRYQRGKDMALALYQLKAHMEEQKALQDLGTMVSAAENLPTLKLANLQELAAQGAPRETPTVPPPPLVPPPPGPPPLPAGMPNGGDDHEVTTAAPDLAAAMEAIPSLPIEGSFENLDQLPPLPGAAPAVTPAPVPAQEWKKIAKAEVNPKWFWRVVAAAGAVCDPRHRVLRAAGQVRGRRPRSRPTRPSSRKCATASRLSKRGRSSSRPGSTNESLAKFRQVLARSPNNEEARKYAQMAENAVKSQQEEAQRREQTAAAVAAARTALTEGRPEEAKQKAEEVLAADAKQRRRAGDSRRGGRKDRRESRRRGGRAQESRQAQGRTGGPKGRRSHAGRQPLARSFGRAAAGAGARPGRRLRHGDRATRLRFADLRRSRHDRRQRPDPPAQALLLQEGREPERPREPDGPIRLRGHQGLAVRARHAVGLRHDDRPALGWRDEDPPPRLRRRQARDPAPVRASPARPGALPKGPESRITRTSSGRSAAW